MVSAARLRTLVAFEDLIDPVSEAFRQSSAGQAQNGLVVMLPAERPDMGDVYVKTGVLAGHPVHIVKVSPWFATNVASGAPQGGFIAVLDSSTGHTLRSSTKSITCPTFERPPPERWPPECSRLSRL